MVERFISLMLAFPCKNIISSIFATIVMSRTVVEQYVKSAKKVIEDFTLDANRVVQITLRDLIISVVSIMENEKSTGPQCLVQSS